LQGHGYNGQEAAFRTKHHTPTALGLLFATALLIGGCGTSETTHVPDPGPGDTLFDELDFGGNDTFDVVTWNIENFTNEYDDNPSERIRYVIAAVKAFAADVVAVQEITSNYAFQQVLAGLDGWDGYRDPEYSGSQKLAYLWNTATVTVTAGPYNIFGWDSNSFPRRPLVLECTYLGQPLVIVNNHLKCCGDGVIAADPDQDDDGWIEDEETRRLNAIVQLEEWIRDNHADDAVILLGDLNDKLTDSTANNVFNVFLDAPADYTFADLPIATGPSSSWSFRYSSHIDHILVTDELFAPLAHGDAEVRTLRMDSYLDSGWGEYETNLSDHLPVGMRLPLGP